MTLKEAYDIGKKQLADVQVPEAELDAWYLLEYVTGISRAVYFAHSEQTLSNEQAKTYERVIKERAKRIPLQHITGIQEFMGYEFRVSPKVLIPRQDTECLVEEVLQVLKPGMRVLDMCTGSGCILLSLMKLCEGIQGTGTDISSDALRIAAENAKALEVSAELLKSDVFETVTGTYDVIVSNPPYIKSKDIESLEEEVRLHDPMLALDGKEDGLYFYRNIIEESWKYLKSGGHLFFEVGYDQREQVESLMKEHGYTDVRGIKDLAGLDRVVCGVYNRAVSEE